MADETLRLVVEAEGASSSDAPSLQSLEENFALLGTSHSQQMSIINGRTSSVTRWVTTLAPKRTGMLTIPAIQDWESLESSSLNHGEGSCSGNGS